MKYILPLCLQALFLIGTFACSKPTTYVPTLTAISGEDEKILERIIKETSVWDETFQNVEISESCLKASYIETRKPSAFSINQGITTVPITKFIYFSNINRFDLYTGKSGWVVYLYDKSDNELFDIRFLDETRAKQFVDIIMGMAKREQAKTAVPKPKA